MKPLLIFGLRGTLVERLHVRNIPQGMPDPHLNVGLTRVWLRHEMLQTLLSLQSVCHLAIWSSTTTRNTKALTDAVFQNSEVWKTNFPDRFGTPPPPGVPAESPLPSADNSVEGGRFSRRKASDSIEVNQPVFQSPVKFEFIWSREHTNPDEFRRGNAIIRDDAFATVKDLSRVFEAFPNVATPSNTILIDDTPSKAKKNAGNFLWVDSCQDLGISDKVGMRRLLKFVEKEILEANIKDVRDVLPYRIRSSTNTD